MPALTDPWRLGPLTVSNRVLLAPLAGIGNWCVRLQAKRHGAGMAVSEMVSSHAVHYGNARTWREMLRIHPQERLGGPVCVQLFGADPAVMRSAAEQVAQLGADAIDINMGCPVVKVMKTGAGAALLGDHVRAVALARAAVEGSGLPVTVKLRSGRCPGEQTGVQLARRLVEDAGVAAITMHPRSAATHHKGMPDYALAGELVRLLPAPVILTGGLRDLHGIRQAFASTGVTAVMLARGALGNPWLFARLLGAREGEPVLAEVLAELRFLITATAEHLGPERATRWLRKAYPWYVPRLAPAGHAAQAFQRQLQRAPDLQAVQALLDGLTAGTTAGEAAPLAV